MAGHGSCRRAVDFNVRKMMYHNELYAASTYALLLPPPILKPMQTTCWIERQADLFGLSRSIMRFGTICVRFLLNKSIYKVTPRQKVAHQSYRLLIS